MDRTFAEGLRGFGPMGIVAMLLIILTGNIVFDNMFVLPVGAVLALLWVWGSRTPWADIGYVRPAHAVLTVVGGLAFGIALKLLMKIIVMPLLGADPINHAYHFLAHNRALLPAAIWAMFMAGFAEETVFRGYLFERFGRMIGHSVAAKITMVALTSTWFGLSHYASQGITGVEQATIVGLVLGTIYAMTGRIWMIMCAHAAFDLTALAMIYYDAETAFAHLVFKS